MNLSLIADSWISLLIAIVFGTLGTLSMKLSHGFQYIKPVICLAFFYTISFVALTFTLKYLELGMVYAVWSGVGTVLMALIGIFYFQESVSFKKIIYLSLVVLGVIGIHLSDKFH